MRQCTSPCATSTKDEQLAVVIPSDITKSDRRSVELEFAEGTLIVASTHTWRLQ